MAVNREMRARVHAKYDGHCAYCGLPLTIKHMQVDHATPRLFGGDDSYENLEPSCRLCNNFKHFHGIEAFRHELQMQVKRCRQYSVNFRNAERFGMIQVLTTEVVFFFERFSPQTRQGHE